MRKLWTIQSEMIAAGKNPAAITSMGERLCR